MKKIHNENNDLFLEIIRQKISAKHNYFKNNCLFLSSENISVTELAEILKKEVSEIVAFFWNKGQVISKNQIISFELLKDYCESKKIKIKKSSGINFGEVINEYLQKLTDNSQLIERPPIVSIMGHIDHGKTTLLDTIRQTNLQVKEIGGITQKITVSQTNFQGKKITFLDTPGHSDFIKMRQRGISLTDIVVLVIEASDGIMFQTEEIINYLHNYQIPVVVFINHKKPEQTDNETNLNRIRAQLQGKGLTPLEWGGETIIVSGSAKKRESVDNLLENILLVTNCKSNLHHPTNGVVIDHYFYAKTGSTVTELLVQDGTIEERDTIFLNGNFSKVKVIHDLYDKKITKALPSDPVRITGLNSAAELGDRFLVINDNEFTKILEKELTSNLEKKNKVAPPPVTKEKKNINLVLLADSQNKLETITELIKKKDSSECNFWIIHRAIGKLNDSIIDLIKITHSTVLAFGLQFNQKQNNIFKENNIPCFSSKLIHEISNKIEEMAESQQKWEEVEETIGISTVIVVIEYSKANIAGCQVISGKIHRNNQVKVMRGEKEIFQGKIKSLQINKEDKTEVTKGHECGIVLNGFNDFHKGDKIIALQTIKKDVKQT